MTVAPTTGDLAADVLDRLAGLAPELVELADAIWAHPETALEEHASAAAQRAVLARHGFAIEAGVAGLETAFVARRSIGAGGPAIGLLGELDALPGLSQDRVPYRAPLVEDGPGHGCGHNLLGAGSLGAAVLAADLAEARGIALDVAYFGCPAEEIGLGKVVMAREGCFDGLDAALCWHPSDFSMPWDGSALALDAIAFRFAGRTAHAAEDPHNGRSALDAVELMNVGVNYLREHIPPGARIHYTIRHGGGAPNVVPDRAISDYLLRAASREEVDRLRDRVFDCARGAALMTGTTVAWRLDGACASVLPNDAISAVLLESLRAAGPPAFDEDDRAFARAIRDTLPPGQIDAALRAAHAPPDLHDRPLHERIDAPFRPGRVLMVSTDVGDVSWCVPTSQLWIAAMPIGTPGHSWQLTASVGSPIGHKGMLALAAALATGTLVLACDGRRLGEARAEFERRTADRRYRTPLTRVPRPRPPGPVDDGGDEGRAPL